MITAIQISPLGQGGTYRLLRCFEILGIDDTIVIYVLAEVRRVVRLPQIVVYCADVVLINDAGGIYVTEQQAEGDRGRGQGVALVVGQVIDGDRDLILIATHIREIHLHLVESVRRDPEGADPSATRGRAPDGYQIIIEHQVNRVLVVGAAASALDPTSVE